MTKMLSRVPRNMIVITRPVFDDEGAKVMKGDTKKQETKRLVAEPKKPFDFTEDEVRDIIAAHGKRAFIGLQPDAEIVSDPKGPQPKDPDAETDDDGLPGDDDL